MMRMLRRLRHRLTPDPDRGYEWWTVYCGPMTGPASGEYHKEIGWSLKLGPVTVFIWLGFRGIAILNRWVFEHSR